MYHHPHLSPTYFVSDMCILHDSLPRYHQTRNNANVVATQRLALYRVYTVVFLYYIHSSFLYDVNKLIDKPLHCIVRVYETCTSHEPLYWKMQQYFHTEQMFEKSVLIGWFSDVKSLLYTKLCRSPRQCIWFDWQLTYIIFPPYSWRIRGY